MEGESAGLLVVVSEWSLRFVLPQLTEGRLDIREYHQREGHKHICRYRRIICREKRSAATRPALTSPKSQILRSQLPLSSRFEGFRSLLHNQTPAVVRDQYCQVSLLAIQVHALAIHVYTPKAE